MTATTIAATVAATPRRIHLSRTDKLRRVRMDCACPGGRISTLPSKARDTIGPVKEGTCW